MPAAKRTRIQTYLDEELVEVVRQRAKEEDRPESREVGRLVRLGLQADAKQYVLGGQAFPTTEDVAAHVKAATEGALTGMPGHDPVVFALLQLRPILKDLCSAA